MKASWDDVRQTFMRSTITQPRSVLIFSYKIGLKILSMRIAGKIKWNGTWEHTRDQSRCHIYVPCFPGLLNKDHLEHVFKQMSTPQCWMESKFPQKPSESLVSWWCLSKKCRKHGFIHFLFPDVEHRNISNTRKWNQLWNSALSCWVLKSETLRITISQKTDWCIVMLCLLVAFLCQYCLLFLNFFLSIQHRTNWKSSINLIKCHNCSSISLHH
jgi:hypothetical protein